MNLEELYKQCDEATVEANKKLPKPCYGNAHGYYCNYQCKSREGCYAISMTKWGECDCKFKASCHVSRQMIKTKIKKRNPKHVCDYVAYFTEEDYAEVKIPEGIIEMQPIED